ncbi:NADH dehydrogenase [ubiquinone] 1 alpha subcomplex subunit 13-B isoform X1 [Amborella trichopoda]|uniref:NADH dehydrogenase [ubiquinone] 1 alpha subcomplex subunit 13 n=2 Tax=Amborella trichopoda TaxID=13333 RepID=U5D8H9_AMBTC|nr:NADH dehydrogenase [ubiquinone] 1 alpha subcomplex subunit 13-B isoform X1 [Amborella trichopoda]ERN18784.1 hypothetical protein AMTR_s00067p00073150 [Amborella trichopoda]|eukprot:XP_006857317.1 NADH dehydrogenase [ubiquinone] 1 alpha subcomplex subunit 13-B isoform X1 [Amborella trichopoda]
MSTSLKREIYRDLCGSYKLEKLGDFGCRLPEFGEIRALPFQIAGITSGLRGLVKMTESMIRKKPGMVSVKEMPVLQDGPPPGGFAPVRYARRIPSKGPSAVAIFLTALGAFCYGMYEVGQGNKVRRAIKEEKYAARRAILPVLQAEEDERFVKEWKKVLEEEARIMKNVPGWKVGESVYNSGKWMPPATGELRPDVW